MRLYRHSGDTDVIKLQFYNVYIMRACYHSEHNLYLQYGIQRENYSFGKYLSLNAWHLNIQDRATPTPDRFSQRYTFQVVLIDVKSDTNLFYCRISTWMSSVCIGIPDFLQRPYSRITSNLSMSARCVSHLSNNLQSLIELISKGLWI